MVTDIHLPEWLDKLIFKELHAHYCPSKSDVTVIDWDKKDVLNYLGTYFPRSYVEAYCIFTEYFNSHEIEWINKDSISAFDFGCGTGGEIVGFIMALDKSCPKIKQVYIKALDGNQSALHLLEKVIDKLPDKVNVKITCNVALVKIDDFYDLSILDSIITNQYDIIMSFKAICEFVTKDCFDKQNAYEYITKVFLSKIKRKGIIVLADISTYNNVSQEWLPEMMDKGLSASNCLTLAKNNGYNQTFTITHSRRTRDRSKISWRIIQR